MSYFVGFLAFAAGMVVCAVMGAIVERREKAEKVRTSITVDVAAHGVRLDTYRSWIIEQGNRLNAIEKKLRIKR